MDPKHDQKIMEQLRRRSALEGLERDELDRKIWDRHGVDVP